jgi:hypothetical protein
MIPGFEPVSDGVEAPTDAAMHQLEPSNRGPALRVAWVEIFGSRVEQRVADNLMISLPFASGAFEPTYVVFIFCVG